MDQSPFLFGKKIYVNGESQLEAQQGIDKDVA